MLEQAIFLLFINPAFPDSEETYGSGIKEVEHSYQSDKPATKNPVLSIDFMMQDAWYNIIRPGFYAVELSPDKKTLFLLEGDKIAARSPIIQRINLDNEVAVPSAEIGLVKNQTVFIIYKKDNLEVHGILYKYSSY